MALHTWIDAAGADGRREVARRTRGFGHLTIAYDDRVPRPKPWLAEQSRWSAEILEGCPDGDLLEACCGAGQVGLLTVALGRRPIVQADACPVACGYARANAEDAGLARLVEVRRGSPCEALSPAERFALMLADPTAAGSDELTRACLDVAGHHLLPGASLVLRVGPGRLEAVRREAAWNDLRVADARHFGDQGSLVRLDVPPGS